MVSGQNAKIEEPNRYGCEMVVHVGTSGFAYKEWKGPFYPEKLSPKEMLHSYSERLGTVEINNTFHRMPTEKLVTSWGEQVPGHFLFAFKAPQVITHIKRLRDVDGETGYLFRSLSALDEKLGPVLFQFPKSFRMDRRRLEEFLNTIPSGVLSTFAFRSPTWQSPEILGLLRERDFSMCIEDTDESPAEAIISTASWGYLRLRRSDYTDADLSQWAQRILSQQWASAFVFFKHEEEAKAPKLAVRLEQLVRPSQSAGEAG